VTLKVTYDHIWYSALLLATPYRVSDSRIHCYITWGLEKLGGHSGSTLAAGIAA
jgi:hypothetical protein